MVRPLRAPVLTLLCIVSSASARAQEANPYEGDPAAMRAGAALFANRCAECHGADAKGLTAPDLTLVWASGTDDGRVFRTIRAGIPGSIMRASSAPDAEIWAVVAYLESISTVAPSNDDTGDPARGRDLFASNCTRCHMAIGSGGRLGPDLSSITRVRPRDVLVRSIRDPSASIRRGYRAVTLVTADGERIQGAVKGEDAFSIQIMDTEERIQGYGKATLREVVHEPYSLMPTFGPDRLAERDLNDLLAYLGSLREAEAGR